MTIGLLVLLGTLAAATVVGVLLRGRRGRVRAGRPTTGADGWTYAGASPDAPDQVLLLQLSSPVCTPCRRAAELLGGFAEGRTDVVHRELDVAARADVAAALGVLSTPTTVGFDASGAEILRVVGVPRLPELASALDGRRPS